MNKNALTKQSKVAVVIPVYDPPLHWEESCLEHMIALQALFPQYQFDFILVNDGSQRNVFHRIRPVLKKSQISHSFYNLKANSGKGKALRTGVSKAKDNTNFFICVDWDFPFGILIIDDILQKLQTDSEVVFVDRGKEYVEKLPIFRSLLTRFWRVMIKEILKLHIQDTQAGVKGFRRTAVPYFLNCQIDTFLHDLEFILRCRRHDVKIGSTAGHIRGGVKFNDFSLAIYAKELRMLIYLTVKFYLKPKYLQANKYAKNNYQR